MKRTLLFLSIACGVALFLFSSWVFICWTWPWCALAPDAFPAWVPESWGPNAEPKSRIINGSKLYASHRVENGKKRLIYSNDSADRRRIHGELSVAGDKLVLKEAYIYPSLELLRIFGNATNLEYSDVGYSRPTIREEKEGGVNGVSWASWGKASFWDKEKEYSDNEKSFMFEFVNPPLSARRIILRFYLKDGEVADIAFNNSLRRIPRRWKTETLPATRTLDPLKVELLKVETEISSLNTYDRSLPGNSRIEFRLTDMRDGQPTQKWRFLNCEFSPSPSTDFRRVVDVSMDSVKPSAETPGVFVGENRTTLWKSSGPWKLRMKFIRDNDFRPDEIFDVPDVVLPDDEQIIMDKREWQMGARTIRLVGIAGKKVDEKGWHGWSGATHIRFENDDSQNSWLRLLSIADEQGNVLWEPSHAEGLAYTSSVFFLPPYNKKDMQLPKKVTLKVGVVWDSRDAEFIVKPSHLVALPAFDIAEEIESLRKEVANGD